MNNTKLKKCIVTSNIPDREVYFKTSYQDLLNDEEAVRDNAGLRTVKFLISHGVKAIYLAGFDGYTHDIQENYGENKLAIITRNVVWDAMNQGMTRVLQEYGRKIRIGFVTNPRNITI